MITHSYPNKISALPSPSFPAMRRETGPASDNRGLGGSSAWPAATFTCTYTTPYGVDSLSYKLLSLYILKHHQSAFNYPILHNEPFLDPAEGLRFQMPSFDPTPVTVALKSFFDYFAT